MGFPRQECWSGLPCPSPGDLPDPGIEPRSPASAGGLFRLPLKGSSCFCCQSCAGASSNQLTRAICEILERILKLAMLGVFIPQELTNAINRGFSFFLSWSRLLNICQYTTGLTPFLETTKLIKKLQKQHG